jgi:VanZ family protein
MKNRRFWIWFGLAVLCMVIIFVMSSQSYSEQDMRPQLNEWIPEERLQSLLPNIEFYYDGGLVTYTLPYDMLEFFIRKLGHVSEFALLTVLWLNALRARQISRGTALLSASLISLLYAASDEWHQSFVPGRTGHAIDVAVDSIGIMLVAVLYFIYIGLRKYKRA